MNEIIKNLTKVIETGVKIYSVDKQTQKIQIIEGLEITKENTDVLVSSYKVDFSEELDTFVKSDKFNNALFKPLKRGIILVDIAGYSKGDTLYQSAILTIFNQVINNVITNLKLFSKGKLIEQIIPTGDGCYIVFNEGINDRFFRAVLMINSEMNRFQNDVLMKFSKDPKKCEKLHIRIGCTLNEIDFFQDAAGNRNCYGIGMNEAARILSYGQKTAEEKFEGQETFDTVFFDETIIDQALPLIEWLKGIKPEIEVVELGDVLDKHQMTRKIWWLKNLPKHLAINMYSPNELIDK